MRFRVLGPLEVERDGRAVDLGRPKQRALLAILLLEANRLVPSDRIVEDLWPGDLPADPAAALQVQVSRLRQVLASGGSDAQAVLESRKPGYVLHVGDDELDASRFERLVADGRRAVEAGSVPEGAARLAEALALWRGPLLADFAGEAFVRGEAARLEELRVAAAEDWVDAELVLGNHATVVGDVRRLAEANPLRERVWAQLMLALYRSDRQAEALRAYAGLRSNLAEELGIEPSPALQRLEEMVLLQKPELDWRPPHEPELRLASGRASRPTRRPSVVAVDDDGYPFVGRHAELDRVRKAWDEALAGGPALVLLGGEPGIGKTRLALEHARRAQREGADVLVGRCDEDLAVPYQPFAEAMARAVRELPADELASLVRHQGAELLRLVPDLADLIPDLIPDLAPPVSSDPETERYRLFDAVGRALATLSRRAPIVLVLDDLQWATTPTLLLLRHLVTRSEPMPVLAIGTYRHTEVDDRHPLAEVLGEPGRLPNVSRVVLGGLDEDAVHGFVRAVTGRPESEGLARSIHTGTAGNPLFMREMVRHVEESGPAGAPGHELDVPEGVRDVVRRRLHRLSDTTNRLLVVASVIGAEYDLAVLQAAAGFDEEAVLSGLEEAVAAGLVADVTGPGLRQRFTHALVRAALYDGLTAARRAQVHRRVAQAVEGLHPGQAHEHLAELSHHYARAAAIGGAPKAVAYSALAGEKALAQLAHDDAAAYFRQAFDLLDTVNVEVDDPVSRIRQRCDLLLALGEAQRRSGDPEHRSTLLDAADLARQLGDAERLATAALANTRSFWSATRRVDRERVATFEDALAALDPGDSPLRARLLARMAVELVYSGNANLVRRLSDEALAMARRLDDDPTLAQVLGPRYNTIRGDPGTLTERLANTAELLAVADRLADPALHCEAQGWRAVAAMEAAEATVAATCLAAFDRLAAAVHQPTMLWYATYMRASRAMLDGRFDHAERLATEAFHLGQAAGQPDADLFLSVQRLQLAFERGALGRWERPLRIALTRDPDSWWFLRSWQALGAVERGDDDTAQAFLDELAANDFADLAFEPTWLHVVSNCAAVAAHLGDGERAARLLELMAPYAAQLVTVSSLAYCGTVDHYLGLLTAALGRHQDADGHFAAAARIHQQVGAPAWLARTRLAWARSMMADGRPAGAPAMLDEAAATAAALGLASVANAVAATRASLGARAPSTTG